MPELSQATLRTAFAEQSLFEDKTWQLSPSPWPLTPAQVAELEAIGTACLEFHTALETLYLRSAAGKNLLRNKPLLAPWVADYLDRGKPAGLVAHARDPKNRGLLPAGLQGAYWRSCMAGVYGGYAKWRYRTGRRTAALRDVMQLLALAPVARGRLGLGLLKDMLLGHVL